MSVYADRFIKQHKEYFTRNKSFIESNSWDDSTMYEDKLQDLTEELVRTSEIKNKTQRDKKQKALREEIASLGDAHHKSKADLFKQENDLTTSIVGRLSSFIKETERTGDRKIDKVQKFIDFTVDIIMIHINKCNEYLNYNMDVLEDSDQEDYKVEYRGKEITFQDSIFKKKISIEDTLDSLNITASVEDLSIKFFKDQKASLVLKEPLVLLNEDVRDITENITINWSVIDSKEMYVNMNPKDIPRWNSKRHYWEQDPVVIQFWQEEYNKITKGITIGGYFIHPWLYFHLNFFRTPIPQKDGTEPNVQPGLRDNEWFFAENLKSCISTEYPDYYSKAMLIYGTRRFGKSVILASLAHWRTLTKFNSFGSIIGGTSSDLSALTSKIKTSMSYIEAPFRLDFIKQKWENGETTFGIKQSASENVQFSSLIVQNLEEGATKGSSQKTAGLAPSVSIYDEIGKYPFLKPYLAALPSFKTPYGFKCVTALAGTGGESDLSRDAMEVLSNPEAYDLLPMDWDLLQKNIDPEYITWKPRVFATFFPGQMAYEDGFIKVDKKFSNFLQIEDEELSKINISTTDWEKNTRLLTSKIEEAKKVKGSKSKLLEQQRKVQYPLDPEDCFLSAEQNIFPGMEARNHRDHLISTGNVGKAVNLYRDNNGKVCYELSNKPYPSFPFSGGHHDSPVTIYEEPPEEPNVNTQLYIAGLDDYKHNSSDGDSLGSLVIFKRNIMDEWSDRIVASYHSRPDPHSKFHQVCHMLLELYGARCFPENEDMLFKEYLDKKYLTDKYLLKGFSFLSEFNLNSNGNRDYGWQPTTKNKQYLLGQLKGYAEESWDIKDEHGNITKTLLGVNKVNDLKILEEFINYKEGENFDGITAFMSALAYSHYLDSTYQSPSLPRNREERREIKHRPRAPFGRTRNKPFK